MFLALELRPTMVYSNSEKPGRSMAVELSVKINYLATCAAFAFVVAILLGAF
jgi:hypothetical protein